MFLRHAAPGTAVPLPVPEVKPAVLGRTRTAAATASGSDEKPCRVHAAPLRPPRRPARAGGRRAGGGRGPAAAHGNARERDPRGPQAPRIETLRLASSYISPPGQRCCLAGEACGRRGNSPGHSGPAFFPRGARGSPRPRPPPPPARDGENTQPKQICTFCLSNQRKLSKDRDRKTAIRS
uniref:Scleraxis bHLH transcription factor n=1 Tax=Rhinopithecus bieti TaxID=61621 RepID=A0A2K6LKU5_RHIBE